MCLSAFLSFSNHLLFSLASVGGGYDRPAYPSG